MKFRPCIDIHNGKVKQIVGGSLRDQAGFARENFVSGEDAAWYASLYRRHNLSGGHVILLNPPSSPYYEETCRQALNALEAFPGGLQVGGGVNPDNACSWLRAGASHVIVTSYVFKDGELHWDRLRKISETAGRDHLVLDVSCRRVQNRYMVVTDRWQKQTQVAVSPRLLETLAEYCSELLVHAVDVEGKASGIEEPLARLLAEYEGLPVTYAGGIGSLEDLETLKACTGGRLDYTIGSALDLFGGQIPFEALL